MNLLNEAYTQNGSNYTVYRHMKSKDMGSEIVPTSLWCADRSFIVAWLSSVATTNCNLLQTNVLCSEVFSLFGYMSLIQNQIEVCE